MKLIHKIFLLIATHSLITAASLKV